MQLLEFCPALCSSCAQTSTPTAAPTSFFCPAGYTIVPLPWGANGGPRVIDNSSCRAINFTFDPAPPAMETTITMASGIGYFPAATEAVNESNGMYAATGTFTVGTRDAVIKSHVKSLPVLAGTSTALSAVKPLPNNVQTILVSNAVFEDEDRHGEGRKVRVMLQVRDGLSWTTDTSQREIELIGTPNQDLLDRGQPRITSRTMCPNLDNGLCELAALRPVDDAFGSVLASDTLAMTYRFTDEQEERAIGNVAVVSVLQPGVQDQGTFFVDLPKRDLYPGEAFKVQITSRFRKYLQTFTVSVSASTGLEVVGGSAVDPAVFSGVFSRNAQTGRSGSGNYFRKVELSADEDSVPVVEDLLEVELRVSADATPETELTFGVNIVQVTDSQGSSLTPASKPFVRSRSGISSVGNGTVYVANASDPIGFFSHLSDSSKTEMVNLAKITGIPQSATITGTVLMRRFAARMVVGSGSGISCLSLTSSSIMTVSTDCVATLTGEEQAGAAQTSALVQYAGYSRFLNMRVLFPFVATVTSDRSLLQPIGDWYDEDRDAGCGLFKHTPGQMNVIVGYGEHSVLSSIDVTSVIAAVTPWQTSNPEVATVDANGTITAVAPGVTLISLRGETSLGSTVTVSDAPLIVIGLDVHQIASVAVDSATSDVLPRATVDIDVVTTPAVLKWEEQSTHVVASVVLDDGTRIPINHASGLHLRSYFPNSIVVGSQPLQQIVVPRSPVKEVASFIHAFWSPNQVCLDTVLADANLTLAVDPPRANSIEVSPSVVQLVRSGGPAALAGLPFFQQLSVSLLFPENRRMNDLASDSRVRYTVAGTSTTSDAISIDADGRIIASVNAATGNLTIAVSFEGQSVSAIVNVVITNYQSIEVQAKPYPTYSGSGYAQSSFTLSRIAGVTPRQYQQAMLSLRMVMMDGSVINLDTASGASTFVVPPAYANGVGILSQENGRSALLTIHAGSDEYYGSIIIIGIFAGIPVTKPLVVTIPQTPVLVSSIENLSLSHAHLDSYGVTMYGPAGKTGQIVFDAVFSDGRKYENAVDSDGNAGLPGLFTFQSETPLSLDIDGTSGAAVLRGNHYRAVSVAVSVANAPLVTSEIRVWCNIQATSTGDIDLGEVRGAPVPVMAVGESRSLPVRVHTGSNYLGAFDILLNFDAAAMSVTSVTNAVSPNDGAVDLVSSIDRSAGTVRLIGTISNSRVRGPDEALAEVAFTTLQAGVHAVSGTVRRLEDNAAIPVTFAQAWAITAGDIEIECSSSRKRRSAPSAHVVGPLSAHSAVSSAASVDHMLDTMQRRRSSSCTSAVQGDMTCDCLFTAGDSLFIQNYINAAILNFATTESPAISETLNRCAWTVAGMDSDSNGAIDVRDATHLLEILAGKAFFVSLNLYATPDTPTCMSTIAATIATGPGSGTIPTSLGVFFALSHTNSTTLDTIRNSPIFEIGSRVAGNETVFRAVQTAVVGSEATYSLSMWTTANLDDVGVAVITVVDVPELAVAVYTGEGLQQYSKLVAMVPMDDGSGTVSVESQTGLTYTPRAVFGSNPGTTQCKYLTGLCQTLPEASNYSAQTTCGAPSSDKFMTGQCTLHTKSVCAERTVCSPGQYSLTEIMNSTTDRTCIDTNSPTQSPSNSPTTTEPTTSPTPSISPSGSPTLSSPTVSPSASPATSFPTVSPSLFPTSSVPTVSPSVSPSASPSDLPTASPSESPTESPSSSPSKVPSISPTISPTTSDPSTAPTGSSPSVFPLPPWHRPHAAQFVPAVVFAFSDIRFRT